MRLRLFMARVTVLVVGCASAACGFSFGNWGDDYCEVKADIKVNGTFSAAIFQATLKSPAGIYYTVSYNRSSGANARYAAAADRRSPSWNSSARLLIYEEEDARPDYSNGSALVCSSLRSDDDDLGATYADVGLLDCEKVYAYPWEQVTCSGYRILLYGDSARLSFGLALCDVNVTSLSYYFLVENAWYVPDCHPENPQALVIGAALLAVGATLLVIGLAVTYWRQRSAHRREAAAACDERAQLNDAAAVR